MAKGRMINNKIASDKRINDLADDTSRLAFTWLVTFADVEGRTHGDPAMVRSLIFPRRDDVTVKQMSAYIQQWADLGLVIWYEAAGDLWIQFPAFLKNQPGLRPERETPSEIPAPPDFIPEEGAEADGVMPDGCRSVDGVMPEQIPVNLTELNRTLTEQNRTTTESKNAAVAAVASAYEKNIGLITPMIADELKDLLDTYPELWITDAIGIAVLSEKRNLRYVNGILKKWQTEGKSNGKGRDAPTKAKTGKDYTGGQYGEFIDH